MSYKYSFIFVFAVSLGFITTVQTNSCDCGNTRTSLDTYSGDCYHGEENESGLCDCPEGWTGNHCQHCQGRFVVDDDCGCISDGNYDYLRFVDCSWFIKPNPTVLEQGKTLRISFFNKDIACQGVDLKIYDGDGEQAPLLVSYSGIVHPSQSITNDVIASSGMAFLKFSSPSMVTSNGYMISYAYIDTVYNLTTEESPWISASVGQSTTYEWSNLTTEGRGSAAVATVDDDTYVYGGLMSGAADHKQMLRFNFPYVSPVFSKNVPKSRFGHSMIKYEDTLLVYGGIIEETYTITNELWSFNTTTEEWTQIGPVASDVPPPLTGHSADFVQLSNGTDVLVVVFGYHPKWRFSNFVFHYDIGNNSWEKVSTTGLIPYGAYGHASASSGSKIYIHGGNKQDGYHQYEVYVYDAEERMWQWLTPIQNVERYLHSMIFADNTLMILAGRAMDDSTECVSVPEIETCDLDTSTWKTQTFGTLMPTGRFGHSSLVINDQMMAFGGFDGIMRSDVFGYTILPRQNCSDFNKSSLCDSAAFCEWTNDTCQELSRDEASKECFEFCAIRHGVCVDCLSSAMKSCSCVYDQDTGLCSESIIANSSRSTGLIMNISFCDTQETEKQRCQSYRNCHLCQEHDQCMWNSSNVGTCEWIGPSPGPGNYSMVECDPACSEYTSCKNCTMAPDCAWCDTTQTCFSASDHYALYPYGNCLDEKVSPDDCGDSCLEFTSCDSCHADSGCGWCTLDIDTGTGTCMAGSVNNSLGNACDDTDWFFNDCPDCQCNGHSTCVNSSICGNCTDDTTGDFCETCDLGFYGNPENGQNCSECECNGHSKECQPYGVCSCQVYGTSGNHCENCSGNSITGNAVNDTCYYEINQGFRYEFNFPQFSKYTHMNFDMCPDTRGNIAITVRSLTVDPSSNYKQPFNVVVTYNSSESSNQTVYRMYWNVTSAQFVLRGEQFSFHGSDKNCVRVYLGFEVPFHFDISLTGSLSNIGILLGAFFSVFILLLIGALIFWKINTYLMRYQHRRRREVELQEMAARPFSCVDFEYNTKLEDEKDLCHISEQPLYGGMAAVGSVLMVLPFGESGTSSEPCIAIGTTMLKTKPTFKDKARQIIQIHRTKNGTDTITGVSNPTLEVEEEVTPPEVHLSSTNDDILTNNSVA